MAEPAELEKEIGVRVIALCGDSVFIEGIEASLRDYAGVEIVRIDPARAGAVRKFDKHNPDIIVFDLTLRQLSSVFNLLRTYTDVLLIGLDIQCDQALFLSGEWRMLPTVADLMQWIETQIQARKGR